jgi:hypothetical protein
VERSGDERVAAAAAETQAPQTQQDGTLPKPVEELERTVPMGREEPLPIRKLPKPFRPVHLIGPGIALTALGVGLGETYQWPRLVIVFGPSVRWLFLLGVTVQLVVMLEMARYAMATGESIFFGAARLWRPVMWFFFACALLIYIWPGHMAVGAQSLESLTNGALPWYPTALVGLLLVGVILTIVKYVYSVVETTLTVFVSILVIGSAIIASLVGSFGDLWDTLRGTVALGGGSAVPSDWFTDEWFPIVVGAVAFAGPSGMQQMWYSLWLRDKGAGMGQYIPRIAGLRGLRDVEKETIPSRGFTFDVDDREEWSKWQAWRRWNFFDATVLFWGITMLTTIIFTVMAISSTKVSPQTADLIRGGEREAALDGMAAAFGQVSGGWTKTVFFLLIGIVGWKQSFGLFDALSRGQADMTYYFAPKARRWSMSRHYIFFVWFIILFGIGTLSWIGTEDGPGIILDTLAFLSAFVMGAYCLLLLFVNNRLLQKKLRPGPISNIALCIGVVLYLGGVVTSWVAYGGLP